MGAFGFIDLGLVIGSKIVSDINESFRNEKKHRKALEQKQETYVDSKGCERLVSNNQKVIKTYVYYDNDLVKTKDYVLKKLGSNEIIRNYSQEEREQQESYYYNKALELGRTAYRLGGIGDFFFHVGINEPQGCRYKDINTGDIYVIRTFYGKKFYMNIKSGMLVRLSDGERKKIEKRQTVDNQHKKKDNNKQQNLMLPFLLEPEEIIQKINEEQKEYFKKYGKIDYRNNCTNGGIDYYED